MNTEQGDVAVLDLITSDEVKGPALATNLCILADENEKPAHNAALAAIKTLVACTVQQINNPTPAANDSEFDANVA